MAGEQEAETLEAAEERRREEQKARTEAEHMERLRRWGGRRLSVWYIRTNVEQGDVFKNAQKAADNTGIPQRIEWLEGGKTAKAATAKREWIDFVEPRRGGSGMGDLRPNWVRRAMGDL